MKTVQRHPTRDLLHQSRQTNLQRQVLGGETDGG